MSSKRHRCGICVHYIERAIRAEREALDASTFKEELTAERAAHAATESARRALECELSAAVTRAERAEAERDYEQRLRRVAERECDRLRRENEALAACRAVSADRDSWKRRAEALANVAAFAKHSTACDRNAAYDVRCVCGLAAARAAVDKDGGGE